jgi:hypothetical protein
VKPDYALIAVLLGLALSAWWLSEKLQQLRDEHKERLLARKVYELNRSHRGWE